MSEKYYQRDRDWEQRVFAVLGCDRQQQHQQWESAVAQLTPLERAGRLRAIVLQTTYERWWPKLRQYANECRQKAPPLDSRLLSRADAQKRHILRTMLERRYQKQNSLQPRRHTAAIACIERVAIADLFDMYQPTRDVACLTPEEHRHWNQQIYDFRIENELGYWWCDQHYWTITETPTTDPFLSTLPIEIRERPGYWIVSEGHSRGSLCGSGTEEVWAWDGRKATRQQGECMWVS